MGHLDGQDDTDDTFVARTCASRAAALKRLDDLWGCAFPWEPVSCAADAARVAAQHALDTAHVAVARSSEREAQARLAASAAKRLRAGAEQANEQLLTALRVADTFAQDAAVALSFAEERESEARQQAAVAHRLQADNVALLRRCTAAEAETAILRAEREAWAAEAEGRRSDWLEAQQGRLERAQAEAFSEVAAARSHALGEVARAEQAVRELEACRATVDAASQLASQSSARADALAAQLADAHAARAEEAGAAQQARDACDALSAQVRLLSRALADATMQLARRSALEDMAKEQLSAAKQAVAAAHEMLDEEEGAGGEAGPSSGAPPLVASDSAADVTQQASPPPRQGGAPVVFGQVPTTPMLRQLTAQAEASHGRTGRRATDEEDW
jgi:hypothetical protein